MGLPIVPTRPIAKTTPEYIDYAVAMWSHLSDPFRVLLQEKLKRSHFLGYALDIIQTIDTNNQLDAAESPLELLDPRLDLRFLNAIDELLGIDADGEGADVAVLAIELDTVGHRGEREDTRAGGEEVAGIVVGVEADEVTVENTQQNFTSDWEDAVVYHYSGLARRLFPHRPNGV